MEQSKFYQIKNITEQEYTLVGCDGSAITRPIQDVDKSASVFTIQDAKDGDVLCYETKDELRIFIYKNGHIHYHCCYYNGHLTTLDSFFIIQKHLLCYIHPATKEQRDLLFQKMHEAGYEWDADKKELKKIESFDKFEGLTDFERTLADICIGWIGEEPGWKEYIKDNADILLKIAIKKFNSVQDTSVKQKPAWSEEDENHIQHISDFIMRNRVGDTDAIYRLEQDVNWLKSLKDRVLPKQEWSEEDKKLIDDTCNLINTLASGYGEKVTEPITLSGTQMIASIKDRLRALVDNRPKNTWKPTEEMLEALYRVIPENTKAISEDEMLLDKLYQGLKYGRVLSEN